MIKVNYLLNVTRLPADLDVALQDSLSPLYESANIYQVLVTSNLLWKVWYIDEYDNIWVEVNLINTNQEAEFHTIVVEKGTFEKIEYDEYDALDCLS